MKTIAHYKNKLWKLLFLVSFIIFLSFESNIGPNANEINFLNKAELNYENIAFELGDAYWNFYSAEAKADLKTPKEKFYNLLINDTLNQIIDNWYPKHQEIKDTILRKRIEKWHDVLLSAKVEYNDEIMKLRNELEEMMEVSGDKDNSNYDFDANMLKLIELRNKKAVELGFDNYVQLIFETNGMGYKWFMSFVDEMDKSTLESYKVLLDEYKTENKIDEFGQKDTYKLVRQFYRNCDPTDIIEDNNIELVKTSLNNIGINYNELPAKLVEMELPAGVGGQGLMINIPNDFRAVMTLNMDIAVWMHEMGHGLHGLFNSINSPILEGYEWIPGNSNPAFSEGMAETNAYFTRNPEWQKKYTKLTEEQINERNNIKNKFAPAFIRFHLNNFMCETELYLHPEKTYSEIQLELAKKYLLVETDNIRTGGLKNIIYVSYPLYLQNYLIADIVATQVHAALLAKFGTNYAFNSEVGDYLTKNLYNTGEYFDWNDRLIHATGKPLDLKTYLDSYNIK